MLALIGFVLLLIYFKVLWLLAPNYQVTEYVKLEVPVMNMKAYEEIWEEHRRPYIYTIKSKNNGEVYIVGIDHTKNPNDPQLDSIRHFWNKSNPDIALVEGKVGNLFTWLQDPVKELGEGGLVTHLANRDRVKLYSWEPPKEEEIEMLIKDFPAQEIAMFYTFRPYFSNMRYGKPDNPEKALQEYLDSRTDSPHLKGVFKSWQELDHKWRKDFPNIEWRDYPAGSGFPPGYLYDIWNRSNLARDEYMIQIILDLIQKGKVVFVTMGSSHAPRIEETLQAAINDLD